MQFFGIILISLRIIPRFLDMKLFANYPTRLLMVDLVNGTISSFVIAYMLALLI